MRTRWRLLRRFPRRYWNWLLCWLIRTCSRSPIAHCAIGFEGVVLDPSMHGNRYWPIYAYATSYPGLLGSVTVQLGQSIDLARYEEPTPRRKSPWPTVAKLLLFGALRTADCVCTVRSCLSQANIRVPHHVLSPAALRRWLQSQGGIYVPFEGV